jgi:hypothetical protein
VSAVAGWYADPSGTAGQLRWWDGTQWTEHLTPDPNVAPQATTDAPPAVATETPPAIADVPAATAEPEPAFVSDAHVAAGWGSGAAATTGRAPAGGGASVPQATTPPAPSWGSAGSGAATKPAWQAPPRPSGDGVRIGLIVAAVVAVLLVAIVGVAFVGLVGFRSTVNEIATEVTVGPDGVEFDRGEVVSAGEVTVGDSIEAAVPGGGSAEIDLVVPGAGTVTLDVRADDFDAVAQLSDESGTVIATNDDRNSAFGDDSLDPLIEIHLEPGTYRVQVRGFAGESGDFELRTS